jgi:hypothetical protein
VSDCPFCKGDDRCARMVEVVMQQMGYDREKALLFIAYIAANTLSNPTVMKYFATLEKVKTAKHELLAAQWNQAVSECGGEG